MGPSPPSPSIRESARRRIGTSSSLFFELFALTDKIWVARDRGFFNDLEPTLAYKSLFSFVYAKLRLRNAAAAPSSQDTGFGLPRIELSRVAGGAPRARSLAPHVKIVKISVRLASLSLFLFLGGGNFATSDRRVRRSDVVLLIEGSGFAFKSCVYLRCNQCHLVDMTMDATKMKATSEGKVGTLNLKNEVCGQTAEMFSSETRKRLVVVLFLGVAPFLPSAMKRYAHAAAGRNFLHQKRIVQLAHTFHCRKKRSSLFSPLPRSALTILCIFVPPVESPISSLATMPLPTLRATNHSMLNQA